MKFVALKSLVVPAVASSLFACLAGCGGAAVPVSASSSADETSGASYPTITFARDGSPPTTQGTLQAAANVRINYDANRLAAAHPECQTGQGSYADTQIEMGVRFNGDPTLTTYQGVADTMNDGSPEWSHNLIPIPGKVNRIDLWFQCGTDAYHDQVFDSNNGGNYIFYPQGPANEVTGTTYTLRGNAIDASFTAGPSVTSSTGSSVPYTFQIAYDDRTSFAGDGYDTIHAVVGLEVETITQGTLNTATNTYWQTIALTRDGDRFVGTFDQSFDEASYPNFIDAQVAISNDQGSWDSNNSQNYQVTF